jgi:hypothetical protein
LEIQLNRKERKKMTSKKVPESECHNRFSEELKKHKNFEVIIQSKNHALGYLHQKGYTNGPPDSFLNERFDLLSTDDKVINMSIKNVKDEKYIKPITRHDVENNYFSRYENIKDNEETYSMLISETLNLGHLQKEILSDLTNTRSYKKTFLKFAKKYTDWGHEFIPRRSGYRKERKIPFFMLDEEEYEKVRYDYKLVPEFSKYCSVCNLDSYKHFDLSLIRPHIEYESFHVNVPTTHDFLCVVCGVDCTTRCSSCKKIFYCSRDCQRKNWSHHKLWCPRFKDPPLLLFPK